MLDYCGYGFRFGSINVGSAMSPKSPVYPDTGRIAASQRIDAQVRLSHARAREHDRSTQKAAAMLRLPRSAGWARSRREQPRQILDNSIG